MHPLVETIFTLQHRLVWRRRAVAACWIAATVLAAALLLGAIDYVVRYADPGLRIMATVALLVAATWAAYRWWYVPSRRRLVPLSVAREVESHFPQLRDSVASAVEFLQQSEDDHAAGSAQLRRLVVTEAQTAVEGLPLDDVVDRRPLRRAAMSLAVVMAVVAVCLAFDARGVGTAFLRLAAPLGATEWPREHHLAFREVPRRLAAGQTFEAELVNKVGPLPDEVHIEYREATDSGTQSSSEPMTPAGDVMVARRENVRHSFAFRAVGGDDDTMRWHWVEVVEPPRLQSLEIVAHPPRYTGLPVAPAERHLDVLAGTAIELRGTASEPLGAARVLLGGGDAIEGDVGPDKTRQHKSSFHIPPGRWLAEDSGPYRIELTDADGVAGVVGQWNMRVEPDSPPSISWQRPMGDLYVTAAALVPIELAVKDNLAVQRVELVVERSRATDGINATNDAGSERKSAAARVELFREPKQPPVPTESAGRGRGETRIVEHAWDLAALTLPVGAHLTLHAEATDYRPGTGRTVGSRRITIITPEELESRIADRQAQVVQRLEHGLASQQATREDVRRVEIAQRDAGALTPGDRNTLETAELGQRRVARMLVDPVEGVPALAGSLLAEMEMNRLASNDLGAAMERLLVELDQLSERALNTADRELTAARKAVETAAQSDGAARADASVSLVPAQAEQLSHSLTTAGTVQEDVIATLERLIGELAGRADYRRLSQQLAALRQDQLEHAQAARAQIGLEILPLRPNELTPAQRAMLNQAAAGQNALAARFEKIQRSIDRLAQDLADEDSEVAGRLTEAASLARHLTIAIDMQETARDIAANRVGQALARETQIADDIQQVLDVLREKAERRPEQLAEQLRAAEGRLAALRQQLASLREQVAQAEAQPAITPQRLEQLGIDQQKMRREIAQLAQQLERLQAIDASQSTRSAAQRLADQGRPPDRNNDQQMAAPQRPSPANEVEKAEQDLEEAARQLAEHRQQAEDDLALEFVRRFQAELAEMVQRQQGVVEETVSLDSQRAPGSPLSNEDADAVARLAGEEQQLAELAREHSKLLFGLGAVRIGLEDAARRLRVAAHRLDAGETGDAAQQAMRHALERLEGMLQAFAQTASEAAPQSQPPPGAGAPPGQQPQRRPTFELLEVKMLRMLQVDLHERTQQFEQRLVGLDGPPAGSERAALAREAAELKAEQGRLVDLVEEMLSRDNEEEPQ